MIEETLQKQEGVDEINCHAIHILNAFYECFKQAH